MQGNPINRDAGRVCELRGLALDLRQEAVRIITEAKHGHIGGALSECDVMTALFHEIMVTGPEQLKNPDHDLFVLSKGHTCEPYYCVLRQRGYIDQATLDGFCQFGALLGGHPNAAIPGVELATGALGHGLSAACGAALVKKRQHQDSEVFVLLGDGELAEGSNWEGAMFAANYDLDNLYVIVDRNRLQLSGPTESIMQLENLRAKWEAFGFEVFSFDGNDMGEILNAFAAARASKGKPKLMLSNTVKGKGVSFMENQASWHAGYPNAEQYEIIQKEFRQAREELGSHE